MGFFNSFNVPEAEEVELVDEEENYAMQKKCFVTSMIFQKNIKEQQLNTGEVVS